MIFYEILLNVVEKLLPFGCAILVLSIVFMLPTLLNCKKNRIENYILILMSCSYGTVMGAIVGYSESKDIGAIIGSVTTFLSLLLGYFSNQKKNKDLQKLIPISLMAINFSLLFAIFISMEQRDVEDDTPQGINSVIKNQEQ